MLKVNPKLQDAFVDFIYERVDYEKGSYKN